MDPRREVAREAARLLYTGASEEYKHAKMQASRSLGIDTMPSNYEVAVELDLLAEELEGKERFQRLVEMREQAFFIMRDLSDYNPALKGSVWRGTVRKGSDIDIDVYSNEPDDITEILEKRYKNQLARLRLTRSEDVFELYMNALAKQFDPHASYFLS